MEEENNKDKNNIDNKDNICEFCNKNFSTKSILNVHKKTARYCLEKQGLNNKEYKCNFCSKILSTPLRLNTHAKICKIKISEEKKDEKSELIKYKSLVESKDKEIEKYKILLHENDKLVHELKTMLSNANQTICEIAKQPKTIHSTTTNSNNNNRIQTNNFDINDIKKISSVLENHLTPAVLAKGQRGVAEMLKEHLLQNENGDLIYECTDVSRQKFEFINPDGNIEYDPKATKLLKSLHKANIFDVTHSTGKKLWQKEDGTVNYDAQHVHMPKVTEVLEINEDSSKLRTHLANITYNREK